MIVAYSENDIERQTNSVVTVGTFDGVHLGHQSIIETVCNHAKSLSGRSVAITFNPHPREIVGRGPVKYLSSLDERLHHLEQLGVEAVRIVPFTYEFSRLQPQDFYFRYIVQEIGVKEVVVGHDHMFGRDREAGTQELQEIGEKLGFDTVTVPPFSSNGTIVSSSVVRELLQRGDVEQAAKLLGRPYTLHGTVVRGDGRGKQLGFPTANIQPDYQNKLVPALGVYFVEVEIGTKQYYGMMNVGTRPTFESSHQQVIEVHVFELQGELYGTKLQVYFLKRLRPEKKFSTQEELIAQLTQDEQQCRQYLSEFSKSHILS